MYTTRKKAIGPFKRELWDLPTKDEILADQGAKVEYLFDQLKVNGTADLLRLVHAQEWHRPAPTSLRG